jgi:hypothetical protein
VDVWHAPDPAGGTVETVIDAPLEAQDAILLERVAPWVDAGTHSFFRAIKPDWHLEVIRHDPPRAFDADDAVHDSSCVLSLIRLEKAGALARSRREILLAGMAAAAEALELDPPRRKALHEDGFRWAIDIGRWDAVAQAGLEARFLALRDGLASIVARAVAGDGAAWGGHEAAAAAMGRWHRLRRPREGGEDQVVEARRRLAHHANRLAVFAEPEAILHYFMFRLLGGAPVGAAS